ncbi:MAG: hypothetical protein OIF55_06440 [Amphritea sp.]|nr:hypothetical protein [Amphritea sp.]
MSVNSEGVTERIVPDDGRKESRWVFLTVLLILIAGGAGIFVNRSEPARLPDYLQLSVNDKAVLTALRNAGDEILFLAEVNDALPDIASLEQAGVPPFAAMPGQQSRYHWQHLSAGCYLGTPKAGSRIEFLLVLEKQVTVFWRPSSGSESHHYSNSGPVGCQPDQHWQEFSNA